MARQTCIDLNAVLVTIIITLMCTGNSKNAKWGGGRVTKWGIKGLD